MAKSGRLINEFSWSFSRQATFAECKKKYWYIYYGSWEGWPKTPWDSRSSIDPLASYLYMVKQMQRLPLYIGSVVHETIEDFLKPQIQGKKCAPVSTKLVADALSRFDKGIEASSKKLWQESPKKHAHLFEHYYDKPIDSSSLEEAKKKIVSCIENWCNSPIIQMIFDERATWISVEEMGAFQLQNKYKIIVVIDFALKWKINGKEIYVLFDWKTGQVTTKTDEQLLSYALFATQAWHAKHNEIILSPFYLFSNEYKKIGYKQSETIELEKLTQVENEIFTACNNMYEMVKDTPFFPGAPPPEPDIFPYTEDRKACLNCSFQKLCQQAEYKDKSKAELEALIPRL